MITNSTEIQVVVSEIKHAGGRIHHHYGFTWYTSCKERI